MILVSSCTCLCPIHWSQVLSREWRCSWSSTDRRCSNYIWVIDNFVDNKVLLILEAWQRMFLYFIIINTSRDNSYLWVKEILWCYGLECEDHDGLHDDTEVVVVWHKVSVCLLLFYRQLYQWRRALHAHPQVLHVEHRHLMDIMTRLKWADKHTEIPSVQEFSHQYMNSFHQGETEIMWKSNWCVRTLFSGASIKWHCIRDWVSKSPSVLHCLLWTFWV